MRVERTRPKNAFRRVERWLVGLVMGAIAFVLERAVLRSIRKGRTEPKPVSPGEPLATSRGTDLSG